MPKLPSLAINEIHHGDCLELMKLIPRSSIDMVLCDLPYGVTDCDWDKEIDLVQLWRHYERVIKPRGAIVLTGTQPFTSKLVMSNLKWFKYEWIWTKGNKGTGYQLVKYKPMVTHENVLVFGNGSVTYIPQKTPRDRPSYSRNSGFNRNIHVSNGKPYVAEAPLTEKYPITEIYFENHSDSGSKVHPTQKPIALFEYLIKTYTLEGNVVLDNCIGSGTTAIACLNTGRNFIGIELDKEYYIIAKERVSDAMKLEQYKKREVLPSLKPERVL
jgi:site-specific DNA-methyltransferase (adenine-specific)